MAGQNHNSYHIDQIAEALKASIPDLDSLRELKKGYSEVPIDTNDPRYDEPTVDITDYNLAGQAYYSRPNVATGVPVAEVPKTLYLRKSVAETLAKINKALANPVIAEFFGGEVELYVEDALRKTSLQKNLFEFVFPALIRANHSGISDEEMIARRKDLIAVPSTDPLRPSPHATGGAVDVILRYKQADKGFVAGSEVPMGHQDGDTSAKINPDYFEKNSQTTDDFIAQKNRRAFYAIMTGAAFGFDSGLVNNPTEFWHWGYGDQMWAKLRQEPVAFYSLIE
jgi:D-alanyl-D-alanine dipeptidase